MRWHFRNFCLGLVGAFMATTAFAQEDMTSLLKNTDMEQGSKGWSFDGSRLLNKNTKSSLHSSGFYGMSNAVLETWNKNPSTGIPNGYIMQRVGDGQLPKGTYVFGAYVGASKQNHRVMNSQTGKYEYWSNKDSIVGVTLFATKPALL